jgi:hypothetical protein
LEDDDNDGDHDKIIIMMTIKYEEVPIHAMKAYRGSTG